MIRATLVYLFIAVYVILLGPPGLAWSLIRGRVSVLYRLTRGCMGMAGWMCGIRLNVRGMEYIRPGRSYFFLSNHLGNFDGPLLFYVIPRDMRALIKKEMMSIPIVSLAMTRAEFVPIDRSHPARAKASIDRAAALLRRGYSFFAFPEGTRSRDGRLGEFKKGVFITALKAGVPVVPVTIRNTGAIQPPGSYAIRPATVEITFHEPIPTEGMTIKDRDRLAEMTRLAIASALEPRTAGA